MDIDAMKCSAYHVFEVMNLKRLDLEVTSMRK